MAQNKENSTYVKDTREKRGENVNEQRLHLSDKQILFS